LVQYQNQGYEIWLELGLQSSFDQTLKRINRGHGFAEYVDAVHRAHARQLKICTHLIIGLPEENMRHNLVTLERVLKLGCEGLKLHPLHVVKGTQLANDWRKGKYTPLHLDDYIKIATAMIQLTPKDVLFHRVTATAQESILLAPNWCNKKWLVLNKITQELIRQKKQLDLPVFILQDCLTIPKR
jgi:radical SAM protein (TIGR01212 family)